MTFDYFFLNLNLNKGENSVLGETFVSPNSGTLIKGVPFINPDFGVIFLPDREKFSIIIVHNSDVNIEAIEKVVISKYITVIVLKEGYDFTINGKTFIIKDNKFLIIDE